MNIPMSKSNEIHVERVVQKTLITKPEYSAKRSLWARRRKVMENSGNTYSPLGVRPRNPDTLFERALAIFGFLLKLTGLYNLGNRLARDIKVNEFDLYFDHLPEKFDGYKILQLTDLHIDKFPGLDDVIIDTVRGITADLCVMTGDFRAADDGPHEQIMAPMSRLVKAIETRDGMYAVLGNHDDHQLGLSLEDRLGIQLLANDQVVIERNTQRLLIAGADDVNRFYTTDAEKVLENHEGAFGIALVHSPEMAEQASKGGFSLYLCGHTHGGQVCLPSGKPLVTHLCRNKELASGLWNIGKMTGYTSSGAGVSGPPVRFFSKGEVTLIHLRKGSPK